ncbi:MAG: hypothetical protein V4726_01860 [Verrucomicrobiota bacterium]
MLLRTLAAGFTLFVSATLASQAREWTNAEGKTITADIVKADAVNVTLKLANGSTPTVKLSTLSRADQDFVKKWLTEQPAAPSAGKTTPSKPKPGLTDPKAPAAPLECTGFDGPWPDEAKVPEELNIETVKEDDVAKTYIYRSTHFEFTSNVQLKKRLVSSCAKIFEATHEYLRLLPLNNTLTGPNKEFFPVELFETKEQYFAAGGITGSAGVCISMGNKSKVLVPLESLGVRKSGKDYTVDPKSGNWHVLSHETTHQLMDFQTKAAIWYAEGSAEYVGCTPYTGGRFKVSTNRTAILEFLTTTGKNNDGRNLGKDIQMIDMESFMAMSQDKFMTNGNTNYGLGCMLAYYFYHLDGNGDAARVKAYLKELLAGVKEEKAREKLLDGRTYVQMGEDFAKGMRKYSIRIKFDPRPAGSAPESKPEEE